ncbi:MAG: hypothetical protein K1X28_02260 [Parachlamydiales bacterium]|nr:hypothetical protein [Parachlamydiales bacterium]
MSFSVNYNAEDLSKAATVLTQAVMDFEKECDEATSSGKPLQNLQARVDQFREEIEALGVQVKQAVDNTLETFSKVKNYSMQGFLNHASILHFSTTFDSVKWLNSFVLDRCERAIKNPKVIGN